MPYVHVLDLQPEPSGRIDNHVDSVKFSGEVVAGLSLLSPAVMRLRHETSDRVVDLFLPERSLYILSGESRYNWGHAIVSREGATGEPGFRPVTFRGHPVTRGRRISIIFRDELVETAVPAPRLFGSLSEEG